MVWNHHASPGQRKQFLCQVTVILDFVFLASMELNLMQMNYVPLFTLLSERSLYNLLPISSTSTSYFYYTFWNLHFTVDKHFDPTDVSLKCSFPSSTWFGFLWLHQLFAFTLSLSPLDAWSWGIQAGEDSNTLGPPTACGSIPVPFRKFPLLKYTLHLILVDIINWHTKSLPPDCSMSFFFLNDMSPFCLIKNHRPSGLNLIAISVIFSPVLISRVIKWYN